jgi:GT2 family glycosyltransferase
MTPHVYAHVLIWNDRRYLADLFSSLKAQTYQNLTVRVLDNGSSDGSATFLKEQYPQSIVAHNVRNLGFATGHNQLIRYTVEHLSPNEEAFILVMNADMILKETVIEELVKALQADPLLGAVQPKLYRAFGEQFGEETLEETTQSEIIDTTGLSVKHGWRMVDRGAGELDRGQYDAATDLFGPSGTMALWRVSALRDVMIEHEAFDDDFFAYREDCDLAWRLARSGWSTAFIPSAIAWHYRGMYGAEKQTWWERLKNRQNQRPFMAALATRNQLFVLIKNLSLWGFILAAPWLLFHEGGRVVYGLVFEPETRRRLLGSWSLWGKMLKKRRAVMNLAKLSEADIRHYVR